MTQIKADSIVNVAGTGAPDFADGVTVAGGSAISSLNLAEAYSQGTEPTSPKNGALWWDTGNDKLYAYIASEWKEIELGATANQLIEFTVDVTSFTNDNVYFSTTVQGEDPRGLVFSPDGTKMYVTGTLTDAVYQYSLSTAWDITTVSYDSVSFSITTEGFNPCGLFFSPDGTNMYWVGYTTDTVFQYTLSTAWDLSTASYANKSIAIGSQEGSAFGLYFSYDGTKMYVMGYATDAVYQYTLATAWDLSTASYDSVSFSLATQDGTPQGIVFNPQGTQMFIAGSAYDDIYQYSLSTAWDLSTASYDSKKLGVTDGFPYNMAFSTDGTKFYYAGGESDRIYQYSTGL